MIKTCPSVEHRIHVETLGNSKKKIGYSEKARNHSKATLQRKEKQDNLQQPLSTLLVPQPLVLKIN
jgi:hypothetical protein